MTCVGNVLAVPRQTDVFKKPRGLGCGVARSTGLILGAVRELVPTDTGNLAREP